MIKRKVLTAVLVALGVFVPLEYKSVAQTGGPAAPQDQAPTQPVPANPQEQPSTQPGSVTPQDQPSTQPTQSSLSKSDKQFMTQAAEGGMAEVQFAQLAAQNASSDAVKDYAQRMIDQHTQVNNQLMALASQKGVTLPTTIGSKYQSTYNQLSKLSGTKFDQAYMKTAGIKAHTQQAALFQREAQKGQDPDVKAFATQVLPAVQDHLQMAKSIVSGNTTGSSTTQPSSNTNMTQPSQPMPESTSSPSLSPSVSPPSGQ